MGIFRYTVVICILFLLSLAAHAQPKQTVTSLFNEAFLVEDFNSESKLWANVSDLESVFKIENGEYNLNRIHPLTPFAITPFVTDEHEKFLIRSAVKFERNTTKMQSIGIIFLIFKDGQGAVVFEINDKKQYRLRQKIGKTYTFISGNKASKGWADTKLIKPEGEYNILEAEVEDGKVDLFINEVMLGSIVVEGYKNGNMGLLIGPASKAKVDYFYIYTTPDESKRIAEVNAAKESATKEPSVEEKFRKLLIENNELKHQLKIEESEREKFKGQCEGRLATQKTLIDSLIKEYAVLSNFANEIRKKQGNQNPAILSKSLKEEINNNAILVSELKMYRDSLEYFKMKYEGSKDTIHLEPNGIIQNKQINKENKANPEKTVPKTIKSTTPPRQ